MNDETAPPLERVIRTPQAMATSLAEQFLANADAGHDAANDEMVQQLRGWKRRRQQQ